VLVLSADTQVLYDRLIARGYDSKKVGENMECEIMQVVAEAARESYAEGIVHVLPSNSPEDMDSNVDRVAAWLDAYKANNGL
jgi:adenylate kinase